MNISVLITSLGGLALILLGMAMMTDGLKTGTGQTIKRLLEKSTGTPLRGISTGFLTTAIAQSSGAITVALIGFVNAGVMSVRQALGVIYGTNIGTTVTAWLVAFLGFGLKIDLLALGLLVVGVALRLSSERRGRQAIGEALAGFGLFFLGLGILQESLTGIASLTAQSIQPAADPAQAGSWQVVLLYLSIGLIVTVLTQSSSASIALVLSAAAGGLLNFEAAAAAVIGANLGSTSTAVLAAIKATSNARRLALGHVVFNILTACVALAILPWLVQLVFLVAGQLELESGMASSLALFHTFFNLMGVLLMLPITRLFAKWLETRFRQADEDLAKPRFIDKTLLSIPTLAEEAIQKELQRFRALVADNAQQLMQGKRLSGAHRESIESLGNSMEDFFQALTTQRMPIEDANKIAQLLRVFRYLHESFVCQGQLNKEGIFRWPELNSDTALSMTHLRDASLAVASFCADSDNQGDHQRIDQRLLAQFREAYADAKNLILQQAAAGKISVGQTSDSLDTLSTLRRLIEQLLKGDEVLSGFSSSPQITASQDTSAPSSTDPQAL
ncbi:MAG: Na/Pi cotransporter family protein [Burkholderiaceae bacterium]